MTDRIALVTGSITGIGRAIACQLAQSGTRILVHGPDLAQRHEDVLKELIDCGAQESEYLACDLRKPDDIFEMLKRIREKYGKLDILVNNAGIQHVAKIDAFPTQSWDDVIAVNLSAAYHTIRLTLPIMRSNGWGRIVNIASVSGLIGAPMKSAYVASKHGLVGLTKVVALETATENITCNAICPGWVRTELAERQLAQRAEGGTKANKEALRRFLSKQPSREFVEPDQVAVLVDFLISEKASQVRGVAWNMDGGYVAI